MCGSLLRYLSEQYGKRSSFHLPVIIETISLSLKGTTSDPYHSGMGVAQIPSHIISKKHALSRGILFYFLLLRFSTHSLVCPWMFHLQNCSIFCAFLLFCTMFRTCAEPKNGWSTICPEQFCMERFESLWIFLCWVRTFSWEIVLVNREYKRTCSCIVIQDFSDRISVLWRHSEDMVMQTAPSWTSIYNILHKKRENKSCCDH